MLAHGYRYHQVVEVKFRDMNAVDKERVIVPLLELMDQGAICRLLTCPFHNHGRDPRALSEEELQAAIDAALRDAEEKAKRDAAAAEEARIQKLREGKAAEKLRLWLKKKGAVRCCKLSRRLVLVISSIPTHFTSSKHHQNGCLVSYVVTPL